MAPIFFHLNTVVFELNAFTANLACLTLAVLYVGSLYLRASGKDRDHPDTIRERFIRVLVVCLVAPLFLWLCCTYSHSYKAHVLFVWMGMRFQGTVLAFLLPLLLTMILFLGPLVLHYMDGIFIIYKDPQYWKRCFSSVIWIRNHIVAPVTEEFIFRACMLPILVPRFGEAVAIFICPLFFGVAHFHHMIEKIKLGENVKTAILQSVFQFSYTTVFGIYSAFLFLRTGHVIAPIIAHAFCNHMGFPNFHEVLAYQYPARQKLVASFVLGLLLWCLLLYPFTEPSLYSNELYTI